MIGKQVKFMGLCLLTFLFLVTACRFQAEPERVWNLREKIVNLALSLVGLNYRNGGHDIDGFDCSGFVYYVYTSFGLEVPRTAKKQASLKKRIDLNQAQAGDILVFKIDGQWHSGVFAGNESFIHAPKENETVARVKLNYFWRNHLKAVVSIIEDF